MILTHINIHDEGKRNDEVFDDTGKMYLIAAFNRLPEDITAENIIRRKYRPWLLSITEEVSGRTLKTYDILDVVFKLQQLRKTNELRNLGSKHHGRVEVKPESEPEAPEEDS
jgi:hypothetical protein